jgi:ABC-type antimicrobial peptide transport system permease subunit
MSDRNQGYVAIPLAGLLCFATALRLDAVSFDLKVSPPSIVASEQQATEARHLAEGLQRDLLVGFSLVGSVLTLVGIYGVLSLSVASRRRELAIRAAVGAGQRDIWKLVFAEGLRLIAGGLVLGIAAALALSRVLRSFLFGVEPTDPATLISVGLLFAGVALLACWVPARRAVKVDPLEALRYE